MAEVPVEELEQSADDLVRYAYHELQRLGRSEVEARAFSSWYGRAFGTLPPEEWLYPAEIVQT
ncbi:hypothetical protein FDA94_13750 [Herbidospora galbida]|uniref:Uncharacterized protein n=1 Tax=Herbidospora galbida TaxID=2575442 RepID=A0A4V5UZE9_9ACTN|nr:hypothetical protein [Herbidospora galbida]TKK88363.1 hypothetical protein FDA94_13750 [Herbidospora galbida]